MPARLVPQSLTGRVFALYAATLIAFLGVAVGLFSYQQFTSELDDALESARILSEVATPTITDSVVIGDYDTVRRTLAKTIQRSPFSSASFIDRSGSVIRVDRAASSAAYAPAWLSDTVAERLTDINTVIAVGGRDYGVLRLRFAPSLIADRIWLVTGYALALAAVTLLAGLLIIRFSLRRWLGPLEGIRQFAWQGSAGRGDAAAPSSVPIEIRETLDAFSRAGAELQVQRVTAAATLNAVADGVITTDSDGRILYANPAAERMFKGAGALAGRDIAGVVAAAFGGRDARGGIAAWSGKRVELAAESGETLALDTTLSPIRGAGGETIGHVLACRDITEAQAYEARLRSELETRQAAISSLGGALREMLPDARRHELAGSDTDLGNVSRLVARLVQEQRVAHDQLREQEREARKLALIAARTDNAVVLTDETGRVVWVNEGFARLTGYTAEEVVGRKPGELLQ
jgi:PAS domain S-box-containing protein